jgi:hypothetical protein
MRDNDHDGTERLHYTTENGEAINTDAGAMALIGRLRCEAMTSVLSVVAARLIEAACISRDDDRGAREYIANAVALLQGKSRFEPSLNRGPCKVREAPADGGIDDSYGLLIKRLRTDTVHGQRMLFVDCGPQFFPLL